MADEVATKTAKDKASGSTDPILARIKTAVSYALECGPKEVSTQVQKDVGDHFTSLISAAKPPTGSDPKPTDGPGIGALLAQRKIDLNTANNTFEVTVTGARSAFVAARETWTGAVGAYELATQNAETSLDSDAATEVATYNSKYNTDSQSRTQMLFYTLQEAAGASLQTFEGTDQTAAEALATAAGALLGAYVAYVTAVEVAQSVRITAVATAYQVFWAAVEGILDAA